MGVYDEDEKKFKTVCKVGEKGGRREGREERREGGRRAERRVAREARVGRCPCL
jgi:hypothetical protein